MIIKIQKKTKRKNNGTTILLVAPIFNAKIMGLQFYL